MARRRKDDNPRPSVVRRPREERRQVPPEIEDLASGRTDRLPRKPRRPRLTDPRATSLVPGVANRDARALFDARVTALREAQSGHPAEAAATARLARGLAEAVLLGLWRGRSVTGFDAFAFDVLGIEPPEAARLAEEGASALGVPRDRLTDEAIAAWMRTEAALLEAGVQGTVRARLTDEGEVLRIELDVGRAPEALDAIGRRLGPLARDRKKA